LEGIVGEEVKISDCSVVRTKHPGVHMVTTTDFFYPLIDDPYVMGRIGCANVLSDLYSMGIEDCDTVLMLLASSEQIRPPHRDTVTRLLMKGFSDQARLAGTSVTGGQSVRNPWPIIGGVATSVLSEKDFIRPENAVPGDLLVLTKPLGTQVAVNAHQWLTTKDDMWVEVASQVTTAEDVERAYQLAGASMNRLNRTGARLMHKYSAHAATDVTGFGLLGHATNLAKEQKAAVDLEISLLPCIKGMPAVNSGALDFGLLRGTSAETSGGLLVCLSPQNAAAFCEEIQRIDGWPAWVVGKVTERTSGNTNTAKLSDGIQVLEI
jgi:selenide,water dikinase